MSGMRAKLQQTARGLGLKLIPVVRVLAQQHLLCLGGGGGI